MLHRRALQVEGGDDSQWIAANIARFLPCGDCRAHWAIQLQQNPPRWWDYFAWTVEVHNSVNARLCKPTFTIDQALERWLVKLDKTVNK